MACTRGQSIGNSFTVRGRRARRTSDATVQPTSPILRLLVERSPGSWRYGVGWDFSSVPRALHRAQLPARLPGCLSCDRREVCTKMPSPAPSWKSDITLGKGFVARRASIFGPFSRPVLSIVIATAKHLHRDVTSARAANTTPGRLGRRKSLSVAPPHRLLMSHPHES